MRFKIHLELTSSRQGILPLNYQYPLSACVYKIISKADESYGSFLHQEGYGIALKKFKFFTFSDLRTPFRINGNRMIMRTTKAELTVCFHLPQAAESFIKGLFLQQQIEIADQYSKAVFEVRQIESLYGKVANNDENSVNEITVKTLSPLVCGKKNESGNYTFLSPLEADFVPMIHANWKAKYSTLYGAEKAELVFKEIEISPVFYSEPPKSRLIAIKSDSSEESKIRGFTGFKLKLKANQEALDLLLNTGAGVYNSLGMGCLEEVI